MGRPCMYFVGRPLSSIAQGSVAPGDSGMLYLHCRGCLSGVASPLALESRRNAEDLSPMLFWLTPFHSNLFLNSYNAQSCTTLHHAVLTAALTRTCAHVHPHLHISKYTYTSTHTFTHILHTRLHLHLHNTCTAFWVATKAKI